MSAILQRSQAQYKTALKLELGLGVVSVVAISAWQAAIALSFGLGFMAIFVPHCLFVYWVLFRKRARTVPNNLSFFYAGEAVKFLSSILLMVAIFVSYRALNAGAFFAGFGLAILLNAFLPFYCTKSF